MKRTLKTRHILVTLALMNAGLAHAQSSNSSINPLVDKCVASAQEVLTQLRGELTKHSHLPSLKDLILFVPKADYSANALFQFKRIEISYPICYELLFRADAMAWVKEVYPEQKTKLTAYDKEITNRTLAAEEKSKPGDAVFPTIPRFLNWAGIGNVPIPTHLGKNVERRADEYIRDQLLMLIGHEVSHLIAKDKPGLTISRETARMQEAKADKNGYELANKYFSYKATPIAMFPMFGLLNRSHSLIPGELDTHPIVECRIAYFFKRTNDVHSFDSIKFTPEDKDYMDAVWASAGARTGIKPAGVTELIDRLLEQPECVLYKTEK